MTNTETIIVNTAIKLLEITLQTDCDNDTADHITKAAIMLLRPSLPEGEE